MKKIEATVEPFSLEEIREALSVLGIGGMTVIEVRGFARQYEHTEIYRGVEHIEESFPKVKIELVVGDKQAASAVDAILKWAKTGKIGEDKIFVSAIEDAIRIRTEERGEQAV